MTNFRISYRFIHDKNSSYNFSSQIQYPAQNKDEAIIKFFKDHQAGEDGKGCFIDSIAEVGAA